MLTYEKVLLAVSLSVAVWSTSIIFTRDAHKSIHDINTSTQNKYTEPNDDTAQWLATRITKRYSRTDPNLAQQVAQYAVKYEHDDFPKAEDIVAVVAIESIFNPKATSKLKQDPAKGLMQVRHGVWKHKIRNEDMTKVSNQIKHGADILAHYYDVLQDKNEAIMAYNVGLTAVLKGRENKKYLSKYYREKQAFTKS
jgi:hypothetical protein